MFCIFKNVKKRKKYITVIQKHLKYVKIKYFSAKDMACDYFLKPFQGEAIKKFRNTIINIGE